MDASAKNASFSFRAPFIGSCEQAAEKQKKSTFHVILKVVTVPFVLVIEIGC